ncbi:hypothetical protein JTB14_012952 [Gonioctena quinquepunctata]|nr:hypothetical protein JTB14_012952 [Gonioctena quinquepunctata]
MFNSGIKGNQRCNGLKTAPSVDQIYNKSLCNSNHSKSRIGYKYIYNNEKHRDRQYITEPMGQSNTTIHGGYSETKVKIEMEDMDFENNVTAHSIIDIGEINIKSESPPVNMKTRPKSGRATHHEVLQRINTDTDVHNHYQQHWFSASLEKFKLEDRSREERIEITRHEFRRYIQQLIRSNIGNPNRFQDLSDHRVNGASSALYKNKYQAGYSRLVSPRLCEMGKCSRPALPCTKHCTLHIMLNTEQALFEYCTAKFADNTQCSTPVFDISHELPLCAEHARKRDNYKLYQEAKPKKLRKKVKPSAMIRPQKRSKKRRKPIIKNNETSVSNAILQIPPRTSSGSDGGEMIEVESSELEVEDMQMVDQVLGLNENGLEQALVTQAHLLEETDISTVLSTIQVDEFSDFFAVNRNGEYEPSREEAEELEKALAAVDNDVKSLEKLSQTQGLLDSLLDEHSLAETLVQLPEMFHNGYTPCGDNMVAQTSSYLLPVEPHSHS